MMEGLIMKKSLLRRRFLKNSIAAAGAATLFSGTQSARAGSECCTKNETIKTLMGLRTIHGNFTDKPIPDDHLDQILKASIQAANSSNMQTYSIIVVKDRAKMKELCGYQGAALLVFCVDYNRIHETAKHLGHDYYSDNMTAFVTGSVNVGLALQTAVIAARSLGIDSLTTNGIHRGDMNRVWEILDLPKEGCFPLMAHVLGYPAEEPAVDKGRLDGVGIFHEEKYHKLTKEDKETIISQYDNKEDHIALNSNWDKDHKHYLDWLHKVWLGRRAKPTSKETQMLTLLKRSGFVELQKG